MGVLKTYIKLSGNQDCGWIGVTRVTKNSNHSLMYLAGNYSFRNNAIAPPGVELGDK